MRDHITFLLNGAVTEVSGVGPTTTLLQWLRRERRLTGTKEGCAEGDCGACTVVVGEFLDGRVRLKAINACIAFLPMLDGTSVTTVEGLTNVTGALHPCQQALVDCHGSQCGFCTPGFVMSLYALYQIQIDHPTGPAAPSTATIDDALAGNLCRCTGYGPIVAAARQMFDVPLHADATVQRDREAKLLASIQHGQALCIEGGGRRMYVPSNEDELAALYLANPDATLIAGATDTGLWVTKHDRALPVTILLSRVHARAWPADATAGGGILLDAGMTHAEAARELAGASPALAELWRRFAGAQIRNAGTIGGNIANASPIGDLAPALIALGATLHLRCGDRRRTMPLENFFIAYGKQDRQRGEFITGIELPAAGITHDFAVHKVSKRFDDDISAVCGAFNIRVVDGVVAEARVAFGGMAAIPKRARAVEAALIDQPFTRPTIDAARARLADDFAPISDARASAAYRLEVAQNLLVRVYIERREPAAMTRLVGNGALAIGP